MERRYGDSTQKIYRHRNCVCLCKSGNDGFTGQARCDSIRTSAHAGIAGTMNGR